MRLLVLWLMFLCIYTSVVYADEYTFSSGDVSIGAPLVYSALSFDPFASNRLTGFWGNSDYGTFGDPDRPGPINVYDGTDGTNVTLRLWFIGIDLTGIEVNTIALVGAVNVGQTDPCHANFAASWLYYWLSDGARAYGFKTVQMNEIGYMGYGPARGWNPSFAGIPSENLFDLCIEFVPVGSTGELRIYGFEKRYNSTETYHFAPGRWIPNHYGWGLCSYELENPVIKDPTDLTPQNRYYNRFSGYPYAQQMNVFTGIQSGVQSDHFSWNKIKVEGTPSGVNISQSIQGKVILSDFIGDITVIPITVELNGTPIVLNLNSQGEFTIQNVAAGTYNIRIKASHWLTKMIPNVVIDGNKNIGEVTLINGDVIDSNEVDFDDINAVRAAYGSFPGDGNWNAMADVDGFGEVDFTDINIVRSNYGAIGE